MARKAIEVNVTVRQRQVLESMANSRCEEHRLVERSRIVLDSAAGISNIEQAARAHMSPSTVGVWRRRWAGHQDHLTLLEEGLSQKQLEARLRVILSDRPRSGAPPKFTGKTVVMLVLLACMAPEALGLPVTHWSPALLAEQAVGLGVVDSISARHLDRILKSFDLRPHKMRYWMHSPDKEENPEDYERRVELICQLYHQAQQLAEEGIRVICCDEKTGIQALERRFGDKPVRQGDCATQDYEYIRHGTLCLTANLEVATGEVIESSVTERRREKEFVEHIRQTVQSDPQAHWVFVCDQLNTHKSASLVEFVAQWCGLDVGLGEKGKQGVLKSMASRKEFLENEQHKLRFAYTPRHCSWLNQIELWFSILQKKLLKRLNVHSSAQLQSCIEEFIGFYNFAQAKPFQWTYRAKPLCV